MKALRHFLLPVIAVLLCANFSSQDSNDLKQICSGKLTYYSNTKEDEIVKITVGPTEGSSSNAGIKFYMIPKRKNIETKDLAYDELKLSQIKSITMLGTPEKEIISIDKKSYVVVQVVVYLNEKGTKTIKYMLPNDTKFYGRKKGTGAKGRYPIASVSKLEMSGCVEEGSTVDLDKMCKRYEETKADPAKVKNAAA